MFEPVREVAGLGILPECHRGVYKVAPLLCHLIDSTHRRGNQDAVLSGEVRGYKRKTDTLTLSKNNLRQSD